MSDPGSTYRTRSEVQEMRETRDPILIFKTKLIKSNLLNDEEQRVRTIHWVRLANATV